MSLLPYKYPKVEQDFASFLMDEKATATYKELDIDPMTCKATLLPHLALGENLNIDGMLEREARLYIANARYIYSIKGTIESALNTLTVVGLHSEEFPAQIIEYRDMKTHTYKQKHNGITKQDGSLKHNGGLSIYAFVLSKWYQIAVIISAPASRRQINIASRLLQEVIPVRCEVVGFINSLRDLHDGTTKQDGSRNHGIWRLN